MEEREKTIVVVGAGVAGLVTAWKLKKLQPLAKITVVEASDRAGGILQTESIDGYLVDRAADMFTTQPGHAFELCRELGHEDDLITTTPVSQRAFVAAEHSIEPVPNGFSLMMPADLNAIRDTTLLDANGRERLLAEVDVPARIDNSDEDFQSFVVRRFGQQAFDRLIQPLVSGIYTADPKKLSMNATMRRFVDMERTYGSLIAAAKASAVGSADRFAHGARYELFRAPRDGMGALIQWLIEDLEDVEIRYRWPAGKVQQSWTGAWLVESKNFDQAPIFADGIVVATSVAKASQLLVDISKPLADSLGAVELASCAVVVLGIDRSQMERFFDGYGIVVPAVCGRKLIAASFSSNKFSGRAPDDKMLIRCFFGGALQGELVDWSDQQLIELAWSELNQLVGLVGTPEIDLVCRWRNAMPQYHLGHLDRVGVIDSALDSFPTLALAGNAYRGVGIPICVQSGLDAATKIARGCFR